MTQVGTPTYTQDFKTLTNSVNTVWENGVTLPGWYVQQDSKVPGVITPNNGSNPNPALFSLGDGSSTDRSLGSISSVATGKHVYVLRLVNQTGSPVNELNVTFDLVQYWNNPGSNDRFGVSFLAGTTSDVQTLIDNNALHSTTGWTVASAIKPPSKGRPGYKPGDRKSVSLNLTGFTLAVGQEILIRFEDAMSTKKFGYNAIGIDNVSITANPGSNAARIYHYVGGNGNSKDDLTLPENWKTNKDGSGTSPKNFTDDFQLFYIDVPNKKGNGQPRTQDPVLPNQWLVSGTGSKVILGDGSADFRLTVAPSAIFTATLDLESQSTLLVNNSNNYDANGIQTPAIDLDVVKNNSTVVYGGNVKQYISEADYYNLEVAGSADKYLFGSSSAIASLNLNSAHIYLNEFDLVVGDGNSTSGSITRNQGFVVTTGTGSLQRFVPNGGTALFPVGSTVNNSFNNLPSYTPANVVQNGTSDLLSVRVLDGYYENYNPSTYLPDGDKVTQNVVGRSWIVEEAIDGGSNISLGLQWTQAAQTPFFIPEQSLLNYFTAADWLDVTNSVYSNTNGPQITGSVSALGVFGVGNGGRNNPLPVELVSFKGRRVKGEVELVWQTAMEKDNDYFTLEQSADGKNFSEVARVKGAGNSNQLKHYSYLHRNAPAKVTYYRLKQTDLDGAFTYSNIVVVSGTSNTGVLAAYPNPSTGQYTIQGIANVTEALVVDATGRIVLKAAASLNNEIGLNLNLADQKPGVYFLRLTSPTQTKTLRLIKK
ncbi:hypothetical protein AAE02nite_03940 [Adhaeribacter aerolatus]|uniref:Secretion system C-terminal sorting domain-containing protein n=2 Tax=Adhaeribacter aerolatus TaxID=670289 RepID=A0A512ASR7_9BACT|nr:hypothetical protein AAE02nite_03940 [Adhaeribacter aerolatus]